MMNVPIVAASRLKGNIRNKYRSSFRVCQRLQIAVADKVLCICRVQIALTKQSAVFLCRAVICIHFLCHVKCSPRIRPARIKCNMGQNLCHLGFCHAIFSRSCQVIFQGMIHNSLADERCNGHNRTGLERQLVLSGPNLTKQNIIVELRKFRRKIIQSISARCLLYHNQYPPCIYLFFSTYFAIAVSFLVH